MKCDFNIKEIENISNGKKYKVLVELPMEVGFVNFINFIVEKGNQDLSFLMKHVKNENGKIYFETTVDLETCAIYNYYFEFKANNQIRYIDKEPLQMTELFDFVCNDDGMRIVGEQVYKFKDLEDPIIGFENRLCTMSEYHAPLFNVISGCGYKPNVKEEGIYENNFFGTYLFGPLLVRNPHFCDYLITKIMEYKEYELKEFNTDTSAYKAYREYLKNFIENQ